MKRLSSIRASHVLLVLASTLAATLAVGQVQPDAKRVLLERAKSFELDTKYQPPPGDSLTHHASGYAKIMCSSVFITGLDPAFAAENVGYFTAPYAERKKLGTPKSTARNAQSRSRCPMEPCASQDRLVVKDV